MLEASTAELPLVAGIKSPTTCTAKRPGGGRYVLGSSAQIEISAMYRQPSEGFSKLNQHDRPTWTQNARQQHPPSHQRQLAGRVMVAVAEGKDPAAERRADRAAGTFEELATRYVEEHARKANRSWRQADALVRRHLLPRWAKLRAADIRKADVKAAFSTIAAPITANQTLAAASAIFSWAIREEVGQVVVNPCLLVRRNAVTSRDRILSDDELPKFWSAFDDAGLVCGSALKMILLTGQRPGEVANMRRDHITDDGWWTMPGKPVEALGWPGTKNGGEPPRLAVGTGEEADRRPG